MSLIFKNKIDETLYKIKSNDLNSAKKLSLKLIKKNKKYFQLQNIYATILYNLKEFNQAIEIYKLALNLNQQYPKPIFIYVNHFTLILHHNFR